MQKLVSGALLPLCLAGRCSSGSPLVLVVLAPLLLLGGTVGWGLGLARLALTPLGRLLGRRRRLLQSEYTLLQRVQLLPNVYLDLIVDPGQGAVEPHLDSDELALGPQLVDRGQEGALVVAVEALGPALEAEGAAEVLLESHPLALKVLPVRFLVPRGIQVERLEGLSPPVN